MTTTTTTAWPTGRPNRYPGSCESCSLHVPAERGVLVKGSSGWEVFHFMPADCEAARERDAERTEVLTNHGGPVTAVGMYRRPDDVVFRVQESEFGNLYAKLVSIDDSDPEYVRVSFEYDRGAIRTLGADMAMTEEEAKAFGAKWGFCVACATELTDPKSVAVGYGKTCASNNGWWYPTKTELKAMLADEAA